MGLSRPSPVVILPGATAATTLDLAPLNIDVTTVAGVPLAGYHVIATPHDLTGCATPVSTLTLGTTDAMGNLLTSLPGGIWDLSVKNPTGTVMTLDGGLPATQVPNYSSVPTPSLVVTDPETAMTVRVA
jgi:hypothetical protein